MRTIIAHEGVRLINCIPLIRPYNTNKDKSKIIKAIYKQSRKYIR
jgi:hypothetical protein